MTIFPLLTGTAASDGSSLPKPALLAILFLCLALPYLFSQYRNRKTGTAKAGSRKGSPQQELLAFVRLLMHAAKKKHYLFLFPGSVKAGDRTATLVALLLTQDRILGISAFGYGGEIIPPKQNDVWHYTLGEKSSSFTGLLAGAEKNRLILQDALHSLDQDSIPIEIISVFTNPTASFRHTPGDNIYTAREFLTLLSDGRWDRSETAFDQKALGEALSAMTNSQQKSR